MPGNDAAIGALTSGAVAMSIVKPGSKTPTLKAAVWPFVAVIVTQMLFAGFCLSMLTAIRSWITAVETWSGSEQSAVYNLTAYANTADEQALERFKQAMKTPLAYLEVNLDWSTDDRETQRSREALTRAGTTKGDTEAIDRSLRYLSRLSYMRRVIALAKQADILTIRLESLANRIHEHLVRKDRSAAVALLPEVEAFNVDAPIVIDGAMQVLGDFARLVEQALAEANLGLAFGLASLTIWRVRRFLKQRRLIESELSWQASHDALTGIGNRRAFEDRLNLATNSEHPSPLALMFLDLDQFKIVNDTCGHAAGDDLLRRICILLQKEIGGRDLLARLGGDEFSIFLPDCSVMQAIGLAETLRAAVQDYNFIWDRRVFRVTASIGLVHVDGHPSTTADLMRAADVACFLAKEKGRNRLHVHRAEDQDIVRHTGEMNWVQRIHQALDEDRFCLYAQDIVPLGDVRDEGLHVELLIRLRDEAGALVPPGSFLPAAERFGLMRLIDRWVVETAFRILAGRLSDAAVEPITCCAINLSGTTLGDDAFLEFLEEQFAKSGISPAIICFEITETSAITNLAAATAFVDDLRNLGCRFSLDDFRFGHVVLRLPQAPSRRLPQDRRKFRQELAERQGRSLDGRGHQPDRARDG